jgi:hypothetical protein
MQGAIGNTLRNTLGITKVQHSHGGRPARPARWARGVYAAALTGCKNIFLPMCVLFHFWPSLLSYQYFENVGHSST